MSSRGAERVKSQDSNSISSELSLSFPKQKDNGRLAISLAMVANVLWGASFIASKYTLQVWAPVTATLIRFILALIIMAIACPFFGYRISLPKGRTEWLGVSLVGVFGFGLLYPMQLKGLLLIPSGLSASLMLTSPLFVLLLAAAVLSEGLSSKKVFAVIVGIFGGVILLDPLALFEKHGGQSSTQIVLGCVFTTLASFLLAASVIVTRKTSGSLNSQSLTFWSICIGSLILVPFACVEPPLEYVSAESMTHAVLAVTFLASICSAFCFLIWNRAISILPAKQLASSMHLKTPVAILLGLLLAHEPLTASTIIGSATITFGVWLSQRG